MSRRRRSYEAGHKPKWLVVIDDTPECDRAIYFAARRAARVGAGVVMLRVIETADRNQQWLGVADIMKAEAHEQANADLDRAVWLNLESAPAHLYRGIERARLGQYGPAQVDFATALALDPDNTDALINRAAIFLTERDPAKALADLDRATELEPASPLAFYNRGHAQFLLRRYDDALQS